MLIHCPPTSAGNGHDHPVAFCHSGPHSAHVDPDQHSRRHGRSVSSHSPNCLFVRCHSASVAAITALSMIVCSSLVGSSGKSSQMKGHGSHGPTLSGAVMACLLGQS